MAKDPYRYFRIEARELVEGLGRGVLELEKGAPDPELIGRLLRLAHTLKGAARVVKEAAIADHCHATEGLLAPHRDTAVAIPKQKTSELLRLLDAITARLALLEPASERATESAPRAPTEEAFETVRVEIDEVDALLEALAEASAQLRALRREMVPIERARRLAGTLSEQLSASASAEPLQASRGPQPAPGRSWGENSGGRRPGAMGSTTRMRATADELRTTLDRLDRGCPPHLEQAESELAQLGAIANQLRLLPASTSFAALERATRDAAAQLDRRVAFETHGGGERLDAHVLFALRDALLHVVRNAVVHGIEPASERIAAGKPAVGRVQLKVERRGSRIAFHCEDDGRGIDVDAVRRVVVARGLIAEDVAAEMGVDDVIPLILAGGITTTAAVTQMSGRGIGLDVVRETARKLKGEVRVRTERMRGTTVEICVPVSLWSLQALMVEVRGTTVSIPLDAVRRTLRLAEADLASAPEGASIAFDGHMIPFLPLQRALRMRQPRAARRTAFAGVVVEAGSRFAAVGVDRLLGTRTVVLRPAPRLAAVAEVVAGMSLDAEGNPEIVLDPLGLLVAAHRGDRSGSEPAVRARPPVLVIDDSLTTRMLEQSILESAGYQVELATSAEEALEKCRDQSFGLFLVDVEMPGMDGFEFVGRTRNDPALRATPAILVTSRNSEEDHRRAREVGAHAYIVKGDFDQVTLLRTIAGLIG